MAAFKIELELISWDWTYAPIYAPVPHLQLRCGLRLCHLESLVLLLQPVNVALQAQDAGVELCLTSLCLLTQLGRK
jgi:hypothetical protein